MVFMPPRHGKSEIGSRRLPAYILGRNPNAKIITASYADSLASRMNRDVQRIIDTEEYSKIFPNTRLAIPGASDGVVRNSELFEIVNREGSYRSAGVGSGITGMGADYGIIDDPFKNAEEANSKVIRDKVEEWYNSTFYTRLEGEDGKAEGNVLVILTRWHEDDLAGRLLARMKEDPLADQWKVVSFPAIKEEIDDHEDDPRETGEALWPDKYPLERLRKIKAVVGSRVWTSLYQQRPTPTEGALVSKEWFKYFDRDVFNQYINVQHVISVDATFKDKSTSDFVVIQHWAKFKNNFYLLARVRERLSFLKTLTAIEQMVRANPDISEILIEDKANGSAIIETLQKRFHGVKAITPHESKIARLEACSPIIESGNVFLPKGEIWVEDFLNEVLFFPNGKHDDQVDAMTQYLNEQRQADGDLLEKLLTW
jgi:predicted phage terminase large subunit-like protein